ncbi:MAG TPA: M48 family peptidase [Lentisphaeria bacterium]|nr:MAG: hypothetical protein A2X47_03580 [Lentisphaerae bacterium GWF2_38_69]HBM15239.1 M48 family peptidase [Lentisphaeria bacterium]
MHFSDPLKIAKIIKSRRTTISLEITHLGELIIRAPIFSNQSQINNFISKHQTWIEKKLELFSNFSESTESDTVYYLGNKYKMILSKELLIPFKFEDNFYFSEKYFNHRKEILQSWLKTKAHDFIIPRFIATANDFSIRFNRVSINRASSRWGSCSAKRNVNFSIRLIMAEPNAIDYVIIHELAHLVELNHSVNFWNEVGRMMPDYREHEKYLRLNAHKFYLR